MAMSSPQQDVAARLSLDIRCVLGTTANNPNGLAVHAATRQFAYCTGIGATLNHIDLDGNLSRHYLLADSVEQPRIALASGLDDRSRGASPLHAAIAHSCGSPRSAKSLRAGVKTMQSIPKFGSPSTQKQRAQSMCCIAFSTDGQTLAIGEGGSKPRILWFKTDSSSAPQAFATDHSSSIQSLAFSPNGKWLCSLGDIHDGSILLWSLESRTSLVALHSRARCVSVISGMDWMGDTLITFGIRHIKAWTPESPNGAATVPSHIEDVFAISPASKIGSSVGLFAGRNVLLGELLNTRFLCAETLNEDMTLLATEKGDICLLRRSAPGDCRLESLINVGHRVECLTIDRENYRVWISTSDAKRWTLPLPPPHADCPFSAVGLLEKVEQIDTKRNLLGVAQSRPIAMACLGNSLISLDAEHAISVEGIVHGPLPMATRTLPLDARSRQSAHGSPVLGVQWVHGDDPSVDRFVTWDAQGVVMWWSRDGESLGQRMIPSPKGVPPTDEFPVEICVLRCDANWFAIGDSSGTIRLLDGDWARCLAFWAHQGDVTSLAIQKTAPDHNLVASAGKDRLIQVLAWDTVQSSVKLVQTLDHHTSTVTEIFFAMQGTRLLSASLDRTVAIHASTSQAEPFAYFVLAQTITLKQSPLTMVLGPMAAKEFAVVTMDKMLQSFEVQTGKMLHASRLMDGKESLLLTNISYLADETGDRNAILAGYCPTRKAIILQDGKTGRLLLQRFCHADGISAMALAQTSIDFEGTLVTAGLDGTIGLWNLTWPSQVSSSGQTSSQLTPSTQKPLRKVLSRRMLAEVTEQPAAAYQVGIEKSNLGSPLTPGQPKRRQLQTRYGGSPERKSESLRVSNRAKSSPRLPLRPLTPPAMQTRKTPKEDPPMSSGMHLNDRLALVRDALQGLLATPTRAWVEADPKNLGAVRKDLVATTLLLREKLQSEDAENNPSYEHDLGFASAQGYSEASQARRVSAPEASRLYGTREKRST